VGTDHTRTPGASCPAVEQLALATQNLNRRAAGPRPGSVALAAQVIDVEGCWSAPATGMTATEWLGDGGARPPSVRGRAAK
jgi:hypothetical protein